MYSLITPVKAVKQAVNSNTLSKLVDDVGLLQIYNVYLQTQIICTESTKKKTVLAATAWLTGLWLIGKDHGLA